MKLRLRKLALAVCFGALVHGAGAVEFAAECSGSRQWTGPEHWATPLYDWRVEDGVLVADAGPGRILQRLTERIEIPDRGFDLQVRIEIAGTSDQRAAAAEVLGGFAVGVRGMMDNPRHVAVWPTGQTLAALRGDGRLVLGGYVSPERLHGAGPIELRLRFDGKRARLQAVCEGGQVSIEAELPAETLRGNCGLIAHAPRLAGQESDSAPVRIRFSHWRGRGEGVVSDPSLAFGPILWTQYTRTGDTVKVNVQMPPIGADDASEVMLEILRDGAWQSVSRATIDPLSRTALIRADVGSGAVSYRIRYRWLGKDCFWKGTFARDPGPGVPLKIGVFSCDYGYAFPLPTVVQNVTIQRPDLLFFAGDQIYESYGGLGIVREPLEKAMLDYLRKYYQFGWTWRELLRDIPSVIIPDDHDVFQGNLWGAGGRHTDNQNAGGYVMPPAWVNAVQRTQTAHLPDPVDPTPVEQGISVYFTEWRWGGVPMAIIEDRKFKSGPESVLPKNYRQVSDARELDVPGAQLLGERQERFLRDWSRRTAGEPLRLVLSQTIFCRATTHTGKSLKRSRWDADSNGWPQSGRRRALEPLRGNSTVMLAGDQHLGMLARQGVDHFGDGPWSFMVPGTANGYPRAWWPDDGRETGDFTDAFGNKFTVLGVANPEPGSNELDPKRKDDPEMTAHRKGSGYGIVAISPDHRHLRFEMWRYLANVAHPEPGDQFKGFPIEINLGEE